MDFEKVTANDKNRLKHDALTQSYDVELNRKQYHSELTLGEIGCYLSHRKVW